MNHRSLVAISEVVFCLAVVVEFVRLLFSDCCLLVSSVSLPLFEFFWSACIDVSSSLGLNGFFVWLFNCCSPSGFFSHALICFCFYALSLSLSLTCSSPCLLIDDYFELFQ